MNFLGALYALTLARVQGFVDRPAGTPIELLVLQKRSAQLAQGRVRLDGKWMAGFHFNSGLLRLAAVYHHGLKILTGDITEAELNRLTQCLVDGRTTEVNATLRAIKGVAPVVLETFWSLQLTD